MLFDVCVACVAFACAAGRFEADAASFVDAFVDVFIVCCLAFTLLVVVDDGLCTILIVDFCVL